MLFLIGILKIIINEELRLFKHYIQDLNEIKKDLENFSEPQWIKEKIAIKELNLNELRQAYEQESKEVKIDMQTQIIQPPKGGNN